MSAGQRRGRRRISIRYRRQPVPGLLQLAIDAQMIAAKSASAKDSYAQAWVGGGHRRL